MPTIVITKVQNPLVGEMQRWQYESCTAYFCVEDPQKWASLYEIESTDRNKGHAQTLIKMAREYYEKKGYEFGGTVALNDVMQHIYDKLGITVFGN